jgi:hypothetical protein
MSPKEGIMFRSLRKSLSICAILVLACAGAQAQDRLTDGGWDLGSDFSGTNNPNGAWSYGWTESDGSRFTLGTQFQPIAGVGGPGYGRLHRGVRE